VPWPSQWSPEVQAIPSLQAVVSARLLHPVADDDGTHPVHGLAALLSPAARQIPAIRQLPATRSWVQWPAPSQVSAVQVLPSDGQAAPGSDRSTVQPPAPSQVTWSSQAPAGRQV
jgi:hypothetical protein